MLVLIAFTLSLDAAALDYSAKCVTTNPRFRDLAANIVVPDGGARDVDIALTAPSSGVALGLAVSSTCGDASGELACAAGVSGLSGNGSVSSLSG